MTVQFDYITLLLKCNITLACTYQVVSVQKNHQLKGRVIHMYIVLQTLVNNLASVTLHLSG